MSDRTGCLMCVVACILSALTVGGLLYALIVWS